MFNFFPQRKDQRSSVTNKAASATKPFNDTRPPLQEIVIGSDNTTSRPIPNMAHHRDIPIHFNEYESQLVGRAFEPISRKRKKTENDGTKSSIYVKKIWEKCSQVCPIGHVTENEQIKEIALEPAGVDQ